MTRLAGSPFFDGRVTLLAGPTFLHINTLARLAGSTPSRRDNQSMRERCWLGQRGQRFTPDARRAGRACLKMGSLSFLHGMPAGQAVSRFCSGIFFFFVVVTNLHISLFIKLSPLLEGMYCSDCLQQKRPNENLLLARISRGREPAHPYLCDVNSSLDLFIKSGLNSGGHIVYKF